jgi:hypothetical protein
MIKKMDTLKNFLFSFKVRTTMTKFQPLLLATKMAATSIPQLPLSHFATRKAVPNLIQAIPVMTAANQRAIRVRTAAIQVRIAVMNMQ